MNASGWCLNLSRKNSPSKILDKYIFLKLGIDEIQRECMMKYIPR